MNKRFTTLLAAAFVFAWTTDSLAGLITYKVTFTASGSLGSQDFSDAAVTVTTVADTSNIAFLYIHLVTYFNPGLTTVDIAGVGSGTFITGTFGAFSFDLAPEIMFVGIIDLSTKKMVGAVSVFGQPLYDLSTKYAVSNWYVPFFPGEVFPTDAGLLTIADVEFSPQKTFTAVPAPEPSTLTFAALGLVSVGGMAWRKCRQAM